MDVAFAHLIRILAVGRLAEGKPEVCLFLADRYWRLADHHAFKGRQRAARRLRIKAERWYAAGGGEDPPPLAVAAAMPVPRRPEITWAVARPRGSPDPPDAA
jgi:hypothetical protein